MRAIDWILEQLPKHSANFVYIATKEVKEGFLLEMDLSGEWDTAIAIRVSAALLDAPWTKRWKMH